MKKIRSHTTSLYLCFIGSVLLNTLTTLAQCGCADRFETTFPAAVKEAPVVIEGKITGGLTIFGGKYDQDWRSSIITVYKVLKGNFEATEVELIEPRVWGDDGCDIGMEVGIFFLYPSKVTTTPRNNIAPNLKFMYQNLADVGCNFVNYNANKFRNGSYGNNPYGIYSLKDIKEKVYDATEQVIGHRYKEIAPLPKKNFGGGNIENVAKIDETQAIGITSISPTTITAGTFDTLTIKGNGFSAEWNVAFRSPDAYDANYVTIPDTIILFAQMRRMIPCTKYWYLV